MIGLGQVAKAITAALTAGYAVFEVAMSAGSAAGETITSGEWVRVAVFTALAGVAVWAIPNSRPDDGTKP